MKLDRHTVPALIRHGVPERTARAAASATETEVTKSISATDSLIVLGGLPGVGKSVAACLWLANVSRGIPECMRWVQSGDLARGYAYDQDAFESLARVFALVIDDFGVEYLDDKGRYLSTLEELLSKRFARMRRTLITTNITEPAVFAVRYGARIASRIHEDGAFIACKGPDLRRRAA